MASVAARVRFHDSVAPVIASRLSTSATGSGFSVSRSSRRCILAMSSVRKQRLASPSPCAASTARMRSAVCALAARRHQFQRHVVEREQHALGAVAAVLPGRRPREQRLVGGGSRRDVAGQNDDVIEAGDHGNSPRVFLAARTFSTPIAIAAVRCGILSALARVTIVVEGAVEDLVFAPHHFLFLPEQLLQILHPFEIADHDAAGIAENVGNQEHLALALFQHQVGVRRGRAVGAFRQHPAFQVFGDLRVDHPLHRRRHQHVAGQRQDLRGVEMPAGWRSRRCCHGAPACRISAGISRPAGSCSAPVWSLTAITLRPY